MSNEKTIDRLKKEISYLQSNIKKETDRDKKNALSKQYYQKKIDLLNVLKNEEAQRPGTRADVFLLDYKNRPKKQKLATGIEMLDEQLKGGFSLGSIMLLGGASFSGKTYISLEILLNIALNNKSVFFNFEMSEDKLAKRLTNQCKKEDTLKNIMIDIDSRGIDALLMEISLYAEEGYKFFLIDSIMKIEDKYNKKQYDSYKDISKKLAKISQVKDVAILLITQISEESLKEGKLYHKGCGDLQYDADLSMFLRKLPNGKKEFIMNKNRETEYNWMCNYTLNEHGETVFMGQRPYME